MPPYDDYNVKNIMVLKKNYSRNNKGIRNYKIDTVVKVIIIVLSLKIKVAGKLKKYRTKDVFKLKH